WRREAERNRRSASRMPRRAAVSATSRSSLSIAQPAPSPTRNSRERCGHHRVAVAATGRARRRSALATATDVFLETKRLEVLIGDLLQRGQRDRGLPLLVL